MGVCESLTQKEFINEFRRLRMRLAEDLNEKSISILKEAELRLNGGDTPSPEKKLRKKGNVLSKQEAYLKYLLK